MQYLRVAIGLKFVSLLAMIFLSGCSGFGFAKYRTQSMATTDFHLARTRNEFAFEQRVNRYSRDEIIEYWGWPDAVEKRGYCEVMIYKNGLSWSGFGVFAGFAPIPVAVPTGKYKNRFYLQNKVALGVVTEFGQIGQAAHRVCAGGACETVETTAVQPAKSSQQSVNEWCSQRQ